MKTLLISGTGDAPGPLRDIITRGSTAVEEKRAVDVRGPRPRVDRLVFWHTRDDHAVRTLAEQWAVRTGDDRPEPVVFVTADAAQAPGTLAPDQLFVWPRDEDRLKMAFMTGA